MILTFSVTPWQLFILLKIINKVRSSFCNLYYFPISLGKEETQDPFHDENGDIKIVGKPLEAEDSKDSFGEKEDGDLEESSNQNEDDDDDEEDNNKVVEIEDLPEEATRVDDENKAHLPAEAQQVISNDNDKEENETPKEAERSTAPAQEPADNKENKALKNNDNDDDDEMLRDIGTSTKNLNNEEVRQLP